MRSGRTKVWATSSSRPKDDVGRHRPGHLRSAARRLAQVLLPRGRVAHQPVHGHASGDKIIVGDRQFEIDYFRVTPGYQQTIAHGGALRERVYARLHHYDGVIIKVEVRP
jgi:hypothetical protein